MKTKQLFQLMEQAFDEIQMPRPPYVLKHLVVKARFTPEQQYAQCVLELSIAYDNLRIATAQAELKQIEIDKARGKSRTQQLERNIKIVELEQLRRAMLGAKREFEVLFKMWAASPTKYTRKELDDAQEKEYLLKLESQARHDLNATGRVSVGNQEGLRQIGKSPYPQLDAIRDVERRFLEEGQCKLLICVPTEKKAEQGLPCVSGITIPNGCQYKMLNVHGRRTDDAYNYAVQEALNDGADYIFTVEDDTFPPPDALVRLMELSRKHPTAAVGGWYPKREPAKEGVHIVLKDGKRQALPADGGVHKVYTLSMGCSLYPMEMFLKIPYPWFKTTENLSQDSFFSQLAREAGYDLLADTSIKCKHIDRVSGEVFE